MPLSYPPSKKNLPSPPPSPPGEREEELSSPLPEEEAGGVYLVGIQDQETDMASAREYVDELGQLAESLEKEVKGRMIVSVKEIQAKFYIGSGKLEEIKREASNLHCDQIIFDCALGPSQQRNIEKFCKMRVCDRQELILDIFAARAATKEAVLQVELARNRYHLPRLTGAWSHLSRQQGGAAGTRGEGEKQIEYDRRMVKRRISALEAELATVRNQRETRRKGRLRGSIANGAIIGYTNAGKSSLLNALTNASVLAEDKLFATLDPTTRRLVLPDKKEVLLTDTVGFVRKLPHTLVEAFKSTLEEAVIADFLLLVLDAASPHVESHWETTLSVLAELGAGSKPTIIVFNKCDLQKDPVILTRLRHVAPEAIFLSALTKEGFPALLERISLQTMGQSSIMELEIPPERADITSQIYSKCRICESSWGENGAFICTVSIPAEHKKIFLPFVVSRQEQG